jgi:hypothetical protein
MTIDYFVKAAASVVIIVCTLCEIVKSNICLANLMYALMLGRPVFFKISNLICGTYHPHVLTGSSVYMCVGARIGVHFSSLWRELFSNKIGGGGLGFGIFSFQIIYYYFV